MGMVIGIGVVVLLAAFVVARMLGGGGAGGAPRFPPGTRAFESEMSLPVIAQMRADRERQLAGAPDDATRTRLEGELANLRKQEQLHQAVIDRGDVSRGKMSIGVNPSRDTID